MDGETVPDDHDRGDHNGDWRHPAENAGHHAVSPISDRLVMRCLGMCRSVRCQLVIGMSFPKAIADPLRDFQEAFCFPYIERPFGWQVGFDDVCHPARTR